MSLSRRAHDTSTAIPATVMPLGGIGTGCVGIAADGGLRQWQLHNTGNHRAALPASFFALRVSRWEPPFDEVRVLQAAGRDAPATPLVDDGVVPAWQRRLLSDERPVDGLTFRGVYPGAELDYRIDDVPLRIGLRAMNPLIPLDVDASSIPAALFTFDLRNTDSRPLHGWLGAALQNAVGWDGIAPLDGVHGAGYGGNTNRVTRDATWTTVALDNATLDADEPRAGSMTLAADDPAAGVLAQWREPAEFLTFLRSRALADGRARLRTATPDAQRHAPRGSVGASPPGSTWNTGLAVPFALEPGERRQLRLTVTWHFPNRYVDFEQFGPPRPEWGATRFWLGNHYATRWPDARGVLDEVRSRWTELDDRTAAWTDTLTDSGLDDREVVHLAAQLTPVRTPTCFRTADGAFFGFEGLLGASTTMWSGAYGGSCPLNCTHVWNYAQAVAAAFPSLEQNMRDTEFTIMQAPQGYLPHRVVVPTYLRQLHGETIGGPDTPALDGMLGAVLKTYREYRRGAPLDWLRNRWPHVRALLDHVDRTWNVDGNGMLSGVQPSTHDIDLCGHNTYQGTFWLAALRAANRMAELAGEDGARYLETAERAARAYDDTLFTGEYYEQQLGPDDARDFQWGSGCLSDQLIGQWWAHQLDLGHLLPPDHVRAALRSVVRYNLRTDFAGFEHDYRHFATDGEAGLVVCSWPHGSRPAVPTRYADEVWTGVEYQVAAHCLWEGLDDDAQRLLDAVWSRYDGRRRNPYNEIECGDHYVRSMAGWSLLDALSGFREDVHDHDWTLRTSPRSLPILAATGWGLWGPTGAGDGWRLTCRSGSFTIARLRLDDAEPRVYDPPLTLRAGESVTVPSS